MNNEIKAPVAPANLTVEDLDKVVAELSTRAPKARSGVKAGDIRSVHTCYVLSTGASSVVI